MKMRLIGGLMLGMSLAAGAQTTNYHLVKVTALDAEKGVDYLYFDEGSRRLYVSHGTSVLVVDVDAGKVVGKIEGMQRVHGIAIAPDGHGFVTSGGNSTVRMFDTKTMATVADIPAAGGPDGIIYEASTKRVFAFDHKAGVMTVIDAKTGAIAGTAELGGQPEFPTTDGKGTVWVNQEDKSTLIKIDAKTMKAVASWKILPQCEGPTGMILDHKERRLYIGCGNEKMVAVKADSGEVVAALPIGVHTDATHFDVEKKLIFNANRSNVTVVRVEGKDKYSVAQNYETLGRANTIAIDAKTHHVFAAGSLAEADMAKLPAGTAKIAAGTFVLQEFAP